jgi:hypothetical protein
MGLQFILTQGNPEWFDSLTIAEKVALLLSTLAIIVSAATYRTNLSMSKSNQTMAQAANASVELAQQALDDQIRNNEISRSASISVVRAQFTTLPDDARIPHVDSEAGNVWGIRLVGFLELEILNEGLATAYQVQVSAAEYDRKMWVERQRWSHRDPDGHFDALPIRSFPFLLSTEIKSCKFAVRRSASEQRWEERLTLGFNIAYRDAHGRQFRSFEVGIFDGDIAITLPATVHRVQSDANQ